MAATCPHPLAHRKPPRLPRRRAAAGEVGAAAAECPNDPTGISSRLPLSAASNCQQQREGSPCLDLARLMLSPGGLPMKKITLEGFTIPVVLRLIDRQESQRVPDEPAAAAAAVALSLTWVEQDGFGFDVLGLTVRRGGEKEEINDGGKAEGGSGGGGGERLKRGAAARHGLLQCQRQQCPEAERVLVVSWRMGVGAADVVLEAESRRQRDMLVDTLETVVSSVRAGRSSAGSGGTGGEDALAAAEAAATTAGNRRGELRRAGSCSAEFLQPSAGAEAVEACDDGDGDYNEATEAEAAALMLAEFDRAAAAAASAATVDTDSGRRTTLAALGSAGPPLSATHPPAVAPRKQCRGDGSSDNAATEKHGGRRRHRRGVSFGPGGEVPPALTRARTSSAVLDGESEAERRHREAQHARRREDAMMRLLAVYDRAADESRAAALRLGAMKLKRLLSGVATRQVEGGWARWCGAVRRANEERQKADRRLWFLHAKANQNNDLLAWYHATFCREVYRRRVPFWFRETQLKPYQKAYRIVDDADSYTPMERSLMGSCVCTVGTKYGDVAAQLFTAKDVLTAEEYRLFQTLVKRGAEAPKVNTKSGKKLPHPMKLRLWFNLGALCLTAKRDRPDGGASKDHSFYLSKIKTCLVALPGSSRRGSRSSNRDDVATPSSRGSNSSGGSGVGQNSFGGDGGVLAPSPANAHTATNGGFFDAAATGGAGEAALPTAAAGGGGGGGGGFQGFLHDEADRGAGWRSKATFGSGISGNEGAKSLANSNASMHPPAAAPGVGPSSSGPQQRVLSIHFFGRAITLDLWFASEPEAVAWQGMLTKLSWKEQGYLYRGPAGAEGGGENEGENRGDERAREAASGREGAGGEGGSDGGSGGGDRMDGQPAVSRIAAPSPAPSSSSSTSIVASEWAHATHGGSPPLQPSPSPLRPPPPCVR